MTKTVICKISEFPVGTAKKVTVEGKEIAVFNVDGEFYAISNVCPHKGYSLSEGEVEEKKVACPGHGWVFDLKTGNEQNLPVSVNKYNVSVEDENVLVET